MSNPISGHTAAQNTLGQDGLRDGDVITSPSVTNALEANHGNGLLRLRDYAYGSSRNVVNGVTGAITLSGSGNVWELDVQGGYCVLDGALYEFGGGPGDSKKLILGDATHGTGTALGAAAADEQSVYVIFLAAEGGLGGGNAGEAGIHFAGGTPVDVTTGVYPTLPEQYLHDYDGVTLTDNEQVIVLGVVRCKQTAVGGAPNAHNVDVVEINDKRVFLRTNPQYMVPLVSGSTALDSAGKDSQVSRAGGDGINNAADLRALHTANEAGDIGLAVGGATQLHDVAALWLSTAQYGAPSTTPPIAGTDGYGYGPEQGEDQATNPTRDVLYLASQVNDEASLETVRLSARGVNAPAAGAVNYGGSTWSITAEGDQIFVLEPDANDIILNPTGDFPEGHIIEIRNNAAGAGADVTFDTAGVNTVMDSTNRYGRFVYEGSVWVLLFRG